MYVGSDEMQMYFIWLCNIFLIIFFYSDDEILSLFALVMLLSSYSRVCLMPAPDCDGQVLTASRRDCCGAFSARS